MNQVSNLKAVILLGTLKPKNHHSNTRTLCNLLIEKLKDENVETELIYLSEFNILPGVESDMGEGDEWPEILKKVLETDILIFATPIWWGIQSSLIQRVIERMDALNDELLETGKSELANKIGGIVITGAEDGAEHIIGNLCNFMIWNGLTIPPASSLSWLGDPGESSQEGLLRKFKEDKTINNGAKTMARNLAFFSRLLKDNPIPEENKN
jgi:multimeric flavodoxin WrbA